LRVIVYPRALLVKRGELNEIGEGETCPAGLGRGNMLWGRGLVGSG